jgi:hypothetical protein
MKKIPIRVTIDTYEECPDDWEDSTIQFHFEENYCIDNIISRLTSEMEERNAKGFCYSCNIAKCEVITDDK